MANNGNLRRLSPSEAREYGRRGGKASGESRRRKADFRKILNALLTAEIDNPEWTPLLEALGLDLSLIHISAVFHRKDRCEWLVTMRFVDWMELYRDAQAWRELKAKER